jgi:rSAM/selenodomain-associated transferase 1
MVAYSGDLDVFKTIVPSNFGLISQGEGDLGDRLSRIFKWSIREGFSRTVILGSDAPSLPNEFIDNAFQLLKNNDLVLGPAWDGGYYLIGLKGSFIPLFEGISWSTRKTLLQTLLKAKNLKKKVEILSPWYDVDSYGDLRFLSLDFLCARSLRAHSTRTYEIMSSLGLFEGHH